MSLHRHANEATDLPGDEQLPRNGKSHGQPTKTSPDSIENAGGIVFADRNDPTSKYWVHKKLGKGSFGVVYSGVRLLDKKPVAIKFEAPDLDSPQLGRERQHYDALKSWDGCPQVYHFGGRHIKFLVLELLGPSLQNLFASCRHKFTMKTVVMVGKQMISAIEKLHENGFVHRDIKPENFLIRTNNTIAVIDLSTCKPYRDAITNEHIQNRNHGSLTGTVRFVSVNTHRGQEQSRRDDLEAIWFVLLYFIRGRLPWQGVEASSLKEKYDKIGNIKEETTIDALCDGYPELSKGLRYIRGLGFKQDPDYNHLRECLSNCLKGGEIEDGQYDWGELLDPAHHISLPTRNIDRAFCVTSFARLYRSRQEILATLLKSAETWLACPFFTMQNAICGDGSTVLFNAEAQTILCEMYECAGNLNFRLCRLQRNVSLMAKFSNERRVADDREDAVVGSAVDKVQTTLARLGCTARQAAWDYLVNGSSGEIGRLKSVLEQLEEVAGAELGSPGLSAAEERGDSDRPTTPEKSLKRGFNLALLSPDHRPGKRVEESFLAKDS